VTATLTPYDALRYCAEQHWVVVGHQLKLLVRPGETVMIAVLARDHRGHFLAVSPLDLDGRSGMGIIDLSTAEARFAESPVFGSHLPN
jgi:hypothetical protein